MTTIADQPAKVTDEVLKEVRSSKRRIAERYADDIERLLEALIAQEREGAEHTEPGPAS